MAHAYSFPHHLTPVSSTPGFIAALFTIAKTQKQHKCPLADEWIKKRWSIYTVEHDSTVKKKEIMPFAATWMDLEIVTLSEVNTICGHLHAKPEKTDTHELSFKTEIDPQTRQTKYGCQRGRGKEGIN